MRVRASKMTTKNSYIAEFSEDDGEWGVVDGRGVVLYEADMSKLLADTLSEFEVR